MIKTLQLHLFGRAALHCTVSWFEHDPEFIGADFAFCHVALIGFCIMSEHMETMLVGDSRKAY